MNFQVNDQTFFVSLGENRGEWLVFVETPTGPRQVPVYNDAAESEDVKLVIEDKKRRQIVN